MTMTGAFTATETQKHSRRATAESGFLRCAGPLVAAVLCLATLAGCERTVSSGSGSNAPATVAETSTVAEAAAEEPASFTVTEKVRGLQHPTSLVFLPDGSLLVGERAGTLRRIGGSGFISTPLAGVPEVSEQGGLLDLALSPQFETNGLVFLSYVEPREDGTTGLAVARAVLDPLALHDVQVVYRQQPGLLAPLEAGGRLSFDADGRLFVGSGQRSAPLGIELPDASGGELLRIEATGKVPHDNPFAARGGGHPEVWSYGHGSIHGLAPDPRTGKLWVAENWSRGGDVINLPRPGANYGPRPLAPEPPVAVPADEEAPQQSPLAVAEAPHHRWNEPQGLSGLAFYTGRPGAPWNDSVFLGSRSGRDLIRLSLEGERVTGEERLLEDVGQRISDVRVDASGNVFVLTDEPDGKLLQIVPPAPQ